MLWATTSTVSTGCAVGVLQARQESGERRREIFNGGRAWQAARVEEQADLAIALKHLIGDAERAGKRRRTALKLVSVDKHHGRKRGARHRRSGGNQLGLRGAPARRAAPAEQAPTAH